MIPSDLSLIVFINYVSPKIKPNRLIFIGCSNGGAHQTISAMQRQPQMSLTGYPTGFPTGLDAKNCN